MKLGDSLLSAAAEGKLSELELALVLGANPNSRDESNRTPLHWACQEGYSDIINCLLNAGANVDSQDNLGFTPLVTATGEGHVEIVALLLKRGAAPNIRVKSDCNRSALHTACSWGHFEVMKLLAAADGIDINLRDDENQTPLFFAKDGGYLEISNYLIARGAI